QKCIFLEEVRASRCPCKRNGRTRKVICQRAALCRQRLSGECGKESACVMSCRPPSFRACPWLSLRADQQGVSGPSGRHDGRGSVAWVSGGERRRSETEAARL